MWICPECKAINHSKGVGCECCGYMQQKKKGFENTITDKTKKSYQCIRFKKEAIKEITYFLNEGYNDSYTAKSLKKEFKDILTKHKQSNNLYVSGYINYFIESGMIESVNGANIYKVNRTKLLPKRKKEINLGILNELGM